ncbi:MAG: NADPH-dependent F420 reductase [Promethearchaeota archaeon]
MKIGIIGAGKVGAALAKKWLEVNHDVTFGVRDPKADKISNLLASLDNKAKALPIKDVFSDFKIIVLAVPGGAVEEIIKNAGELTNKILVDCTNVRPGTLTGKSDDVFISQAELIAKWAKKAHLIKAFNTIGFDIMENTQFGDLKADGYICGDDTKSLDIVSQLVKDADFDVVNIGNLAMARYLESLAWFWITLSQTEGRNIAFKLLRR